MLTIRREINKLISRLSNMGITNAHIVLLRMVF